MQSIPKQNNLIPIHQTITTNPQFSKQINENIFPIKSYKNTYKKGKKKENFIQEMKRGFIKHPYLYVKVPNKIKKERKHKSLFFHNRWIVHIFYKIGRHIFLYFILY